ncbi:uncharacterized protein BDR25DRAFT_361880 [Lindgomyces ingoldianus]|uniref:Uncharacterized protein n=1 Tax=Lindgomyces ingoldianus TaxID=673940 RepID=A0ACB6QCA9_9PLEO|nr:uncharacterized protein BDR25DRAFT_361880 [Lindgomyces ingoldianus]KAF2464140.1 hypothetical protein BDR25DRAFT_361880 [Lindgomyces ingoldianus]
MAFFQLWLNSTAPDPLMWTLSVWVGIILFYCLSSSGTSTAHTVNGTKSGALAKQIKPHEALVRAVGLNQSRPGVLQENHCLLASTQATRTPRANFVEVTSTKGVHMGPEMEANGRHPLLVKPELTIYRREASRSITHSLSEFRTDLLAEESYKGLKCQPSLQERRKVGSTSEISSHVYEPGLRLEADQLGFLVLQSGKNRTGNSPSPDASCLSIHTKLACLSLFRRKLISGDKLFRCFFSVKYTRHRLHRCRLALPGDQKQAPKRLILSSERCLPRSSSKATTPTKRSTTFEINPFHAYQSANRIKALLVTDGTKTTAFSVTPCKRVCLLTMTNGKNGIWPSTDWILVSMRHGEHKNTWDPSHRLARFTADNRVGYTDGTIPYLNIGGGNDNRVRQQYHAHQLPRPYWHQGHQKLVGPFSLYGGLHRHHVRGIIMLLSRTLKHVAFMSMFSTTHTASQDPWEFEMAASSTPILSRKRLIPSSSVSISALACIGGNICSEFSADEGALSYSDRPNNTLFQPLDSSRRYSNRDDMTGSRFKLPTKIRNDVYKPVLVDSLPLHTVRKGYEIRRQRKYHGLTDSLPHALPANHERANKFVKQRGGLSGNAGKFVSDVAVRSDVAYTITDSQSSSIVDLQLTIEAFFITRNATGPGCSLRGSSTALAQLKTHFSAMNKKLKTSPAFILVSKPIDYSVFHRFLSTALLELAGISCPGPQFAASVVFPPPPPLILLDMIPPFEIVTTGIFIDAEMASKSPKTFDAYLASMIKASPNVGAMLAQTTLSCAERDLKPANRFTLQKLNKSCLQKAAGKTLYIAKVLRKRYRRPSPPPDAAYYMRNNFGSKTAIIIDYATGHTPASSEGALSGGSGFPSPGVFELIFRFINLNQMPALNSIYLPDLPPFVDGGARRVGLVLDADACASDFREDELGESSVGVGVQNNGLLSYIVILSSAGFLITIWFRLPTTMNLVPNMLAYHCDISSFMPREP